MTTIATALQELGITEWSLRGEPTTEDEFNEMFRKVIGSEESSDPSKFGVTWKQASAKKTELVNAKPMADLRAERDRRLAETDWMANSDVTMSDAWKTYRQNLRDVPAQSGVTGLDDVTWPTKPS